MRVEPSHDGGLSETAESNREAGVSSAGTGLVAVPLADGGGPIRVDADPLGGANTASTADPGRRRRRLALVVVAVATLSAAGGTYVGSRLRSPADAAADREAPVASRITVPVTRQALSSTLTLSGGIQYAEPFTLKLSGSVGLGDGDAAVITRVPEVDAPAVEGDAILDVSGRPVFLFVGAAPMYRSLASGSTGADVLAVEEALDRLGFPPGTVDETFDAGTEEALDAFYLSRGYVHVGPSTTDLEQLRQLHAAIAAAEEALRQAQTALTAAGERPHGAELLALQQSAHTARDAEPRAQSTAQRNNEAATQAVATATTTRDAAIVRRNAAKTQMDAVSAPGAIDPSTGEAYTPAGIAGFQSVLADTATALAAAELELTNALTAQATTIDQGLADIASATNARVLAEAQLADATKAPDTMAAQLAVANAQAAVEQANAEYATADARIGTRLPAGEIVFVPTLPSTVTAITAVIGGSATGDLMTLSSSITTVIGKVGKADSDLVVVGAPVSIELRDYDIVVPGIVTSVGPPPASGDGGAEGDGTSNGGGSRLQVVVQADDPQVITDYVSASVRILIEVASTGTDVLVVPIAAISVGGDGSSRVEVERAPATAGEPGRTEMVPVDVGLTAQGLVEITPVSGAPLAEGDRVVVGTDAPGVTADEPGAADGTGGAGASGVSSTEPSAG